MTRRTQAATRAPSEAPTIQTISSDSASPVQTSVAPDRWFSPTPPVNTKVPGQSEAGWIPKQARDYVDLAVSFPATTSPWK